MRFLFVVSGRNVPSTRFRILPYIPYLEEKGHVCDVAYSFPEKYDYFPRIGWRLSQLLKRAVRHWHATLARARKYDAIIIEREVFDNEDWTIEKRLRAATSHLVLDIDDGVFLLHPEKMEQVSRMVDVAIAGNAHLREYLEARCSWVSQIPTCVLLKDYRVRPPEQQRSNGVHIGWIGTAQNVAFLEVAAPALRETAKQFDCRLVVVAPSNEHLRNIDLGNMSVDFRPWDPATEVQHLMDMDLGLMPLPDGQEWMKYKCGLKLIQYLAVGIPGIASPIGVNEEIVASGAVGRAALNTREWQDALAELIQNRELRQEMGAQGRRLVENEFSIEGNVDRFERILLAQR